MSVVGMSGIIGQAEIDFADTETTGNSELDKNDFLTLLVAQLQNQDPLNPVEDTEFTSQLAEFSSLEQLTEISTTLDGMAESSTQEDLLSATSFIGKTVVAEGSSVTKNGDSVSSIYFSLDEAMAAGYVNVFDANGNLIRSEQMTAKAAGSYSYTWDGKDYEGDEVDDGVYYVSMAAESAEGSAILIYTDVSGEVTGAQTYNDTPYLILSDGRYVKMSDVTEVVTTGTSSSTDSTEEDTTTDEDTSSEE